MPLLGHVRDASGVVAFGVEMLGDQEKGGEGAVFSWECMRLRILKNSTRQRGARID